MALVGDFLDSASDPVPSREEGSVNAKAQGQVLHDYIFSGPTFDSAPAVRANSNISSSHFNRCAGVVRSQSRNCASSTSDQVTGQSVSVLAVIGWASCVGFDFNQLLNVVEVFVPSGLAFHFNQIVDRTHAHLGVSQIHQY